MIPLLLLKKRLGDAYKRAFLMPRILGAERRGKEVVGMRRNNLFSHQAAAEFASFLVSLVEKETTHSGKGNERHNHKEPCDFCHLDLQFPVSVKFSAEEESRNSDQTNNDNNEGCPSIRGDRHTLAPVGNGRLFGVPMSQMLEVKDRPNKGYDPAENKKVNRIIRHLFGMPVAKELEIQKSYDTNHHQTQDQQISGTLSHLKSLLFASDNIKYNSSSDKEQSQKNAQSELKDGKRPLRDDPQNQNGHTKFGSIIEEPADIFCHFLYHDDVFYRRALEVSI